MDISILREKAAIRRDQARAILDILERVPQDEQKHELELAYLINSNRELRLRITTAVNTLYECKG